MSRKWSEEQRQAFSQRRKAEVAAGIRVPPNNHMRGNKEFRHTDDTKMLIRERVKQARERIMEERGSYLTPEGLESRNKKMLANLTPDRRQKFRESTKEALDKAHERLASKADAFAEKYLPSIKQMQKKGLNLMQIAERMNRDGHLSPQGSRWTDQTVRQILKRTGNFKSPKRKGHNAEIERKRRADEFAAKFLPMIKRMKNDGLNLSQIAEKLNDQGHKSRRNAPWTYQSVREILKRGETMVSDRILPVVKTRDLSSEILGVPSQQTAQKEIKVETGKRIIGWNRKL